MSYYAPFATTSRQPAGLRIPGPSIPSPVGPVGQPRAFVDPMVRAKIQAAYAGGVNYRNPDGSYAAATIEQAKEIQQQLDSGRRQR